MTRRGDGQPGLSLRDNPKGSNPPHAFQGSSEISSAGLEKIMARFDKLEFRLESRCEEIDRRVTKLQASRATYGQQHYVDFYSGSRRLRTWWDPHSQTSGCRVGEIRDPPLPEPPPQPVPELFYGPPPCETSDTLASKHTTRPSFGPRGFLDADSAMPPRFPPSAYTGQQREQPQNRNRHLHPTFPSSHTPTHPQLVLDQKPPL